MGILRAFGFGIFLLILASLLPAVFMELSNTLIAVLHSFANAFTAAGVLASYAAHLPSSPLYH